MLNRRGFLRHAAAATSVVCVGCGMRHAAAQTKRREVMVGGKRVRTVDVHAHCSVPDVLDLVKGTAMEKMLLGQLKGRLGFPVAAERVADMDKEGMDVQALSINAFWYGADPDLARRIFDLQAQKLAEWCKAIPGRFVAYAPVSLQHPEIAAEQLERGMKQFGLVGAGIAPTVAGEEIAAAKFDPFWKKAEELQALVFIHPTVGAQDTTGIAKRVKGSGALGNVIGNPLETSIALAHLIFQGTLDKFPNLKICAAHGGGYLPSYAARMDHGCSVFPAQCQGPTLKKKPCGISQAALFRLARVHAARRSAISSPSMARARSSSAPITQCPGSRPRSITCSIRPASPTMSALPFSAAMPPSSSSFLHRSSGAADGQQFETRSLRSSA